MKLISVDAKGNRASWLMDVKSHVTGRETVTNVIAAETGALPRVVLALIQGGKK
jgi:hypothetical protein